MDDIAPPQSWEVQHGSVPLFCQVFFVTRHFAGFPLVHALDWLPGSEQFQHNISL